MMFLKTPKKSTDPRLRSLLQKAARRGYEHVAMKALSRLYDVGDKGWIRSRTIVITFEECWPLADSLNVEAELSSKRRALLRVTGATKQKDAAGLGALAHAYLEGDRSMLDCVPDEKLLRIVAEAVKRPKEFFAWLLSKYRTNRTSGVITTAQKYLAAATWPWDKACILAGAVLSTESDVPSPPQARVPSDDFPYWIALDKHTPQGKIALADVAKQLNVTYRRLIWASFYCEGALVNDLIPSEWWEAEKKWRLRKAGLSQAVADELWANARPILSQTLEAEASALKKTVEAAQVPDAPTQGDLL